MTRYVHHVGSLPAELTTGDAAVLDWFADHSAGRPVTALPCDLDPDWILGYLLDRARHTDVLTVVRPGGYDDYGDFPSYGLKPGARLEPRHVAMDRVERIGQVVADFDAVRARRPELAGTKLQISLPNPLDLAMFVFAGAAVGTGIPVGRALRRAPLLATALRQLPVFTDAALSEVTTITERYGDRVVWQLESPFALLSVVKADELGLGWAAAGPVARQLAHLLGRLHELGAAVVVHLCYGDYKHESLLAPRSLAPAARLLDRLGRLLTQREVGLPAVHVPCAYGAAPAPLDPGFYAPLRRLDPAWRLIAGVASPRSESDSVRALALFEEGAGRTAFGVATACGLGRCSVSDAERAVAATVAAAGAAVARG
ncbi:hypothetical protein [Nocardia farcinica]|uniref:hypothetical protein n=1 Tax=Nocardia farcinica TaxID=37329 RepID=UPI0018957A44|nr:hypothetical protein [Nocardia farcinica]MBF6267788.1 hypothetical protein [Nocardia farcinica]